MGKVLDFFKNIWSKVSTFCKNTYKKVTTWFKEKTKDIKWKDVWDKVTTGILILLMASPLLILGYIFIWFLNK